MQRLRNSSLGLLVVIVHVLGLLAWLTAGHIVPAPNKLVADPITVWLPQLSAEDPKPAPQQPLPRRDKSRQLGSAVYSQEVPLAATPSAPGAAATPPVEGAKDPAPPAPASPLNLTLPRSVISSLAAPTLADKSPFHKPLPMTVERRIAQVAEESGPWTEERVDYDHIRLRRGNTCVMMERPAASRIDPSNDALQRLPWLANVSTCH